MPQTLTIPPAIAELGFTIEVPDGFLHVETPREDVDFDNPTQSAPLALFSSQVALALMAVAGRRTRRRACCSGRSTCAISSALRLSRSSRGRRRGRMPIPRSSR